MRVSQKNKGAQDAQNKKGREGGIQIKGGVWAKEQGGRSQNKGVWELGRGRNKVLQESEQGKSQNKGGGGGGLHLGIGGFDR